MPHPLVLCGLPRTGSTLLYNLMACDPACRAPLYVEMARPVPPLARSDTTGQMQRNTAAQGFREILNASGLADYQQATRASHSHFTHEEDLYILYHAGYSWFPAMLTAPDDNELLSVSEIRQIQSGVGTYKYYFNNDEYANIIDGSISWDGTPFIKQELYNTIDTLKDALVTVRSSTRCDCKIIEAKIIDPNTMLLYNLETKGYFYCSSCSIEYKSIRPHQDGTTLKFEFKKNDTKYNGTLSYLMRGITWSPNYDLFIKDTNTCNLRAYANIRNNQQQEYQIDNTYLYSGDIQLANTYPSYYPIQAMQIAAGMSPTSSSSIQLDGEQKGFYFYSLKDDYTLRPKSSIRLPFINVNPKCKFYYKTTTGISIGQYKGIFQRNYDLISDQFLPAGILTIRDNQILMGQSNLPDVPVNYNQTIVLGQDNDVQYSIKGNLISSNKNTTTILWQTYQLDVNIFNYKDKDVQGQLDFYGAIQTNIDKTTCNSIKLDGTMINFTFQLKKNNNYQCRIIVTLTWG
ncbi:unnamed protein product [Rotaria sordida]|uniref:Sulfotransferase n=2 Tax=Rotaria sordida TaxID=392033 RepID=A0A813S4C0_9BILA|nr:unnamed protein product [Rotaria sordida]CAF3575491.1 unnamed protein product [Rotaria sordida]